MHLVHLRCKGARVEQVQVNEKKAAKVVHLYTEGVQGAKVIKKKQRINDKETIDYAPLHRTVYQV